MRWRARVEPLPEDGSVRTIRKFCWWPTWTGTEWCWLERVTLRQRCRIINDWTCASTYARWEPLPADQGEAVDGGVDRTPPPVTAMAHPELMQQLNQLELIAEDLEATHMWLDTQRVPRFDLSTAEPQEYSLVGRIQLYMSTLHRSAHA